MATNTPKNTTITSTTPVGVPNLPGAPAPLVLPARPEPVALHAANSALIVVDMQNAYASIGGYVDSAGFDISGAQGTIANIARTIEASRAAGILVVFLQNGWDAGYVEAGGPGSPNWYKSNALKTMRKKPELQGKFLAKGGWDYELIDAMLPQAGDIVISKTRYSGFFNSTLDSTLRARSIRNLVFTGIATNVCVESTLRDAFHLEYFSVMLEDATHELGGAAIQKATVYNVETFFGWVSTVEDFCKTVVPELLAPASTPERGAEGDRSRKTFMPKQAIIPPGTTTPIAPFVPGIVADGIVYVSGTLPFDKDNNVVHVGDATLQTRHVLETIKSVISTAGGTMDDVTFNMIMIKDWADYAKVNAVYAEYFPGVKPARYCIQCGLVKPEALVEIASIAHVGEP